MWNEAWTKLLPSEAIHQRVYGLISLTTVMISTISPRISKISREINQRKEALIGEGNLKLLLCCSQKEYCNKPVISQVHLYNTLVRPWVVNSILPLCYYYTCTHCTCAVHIYLQSYVVGNTCLISTSWSALTSNKHFTSRFILVS